MTRIAPRHRLRSPDHRGLYAEVLEDRRMLHVLTTGTGDGSLTITVDGYGSFGDAVGFFPNGGAMFNPIGPLGAASTTFESAVAVRLGNAGPRRFLSSGSILTSEPLPAPVVTGNASSAFSTFSSDGIDVELTQSVSIMVDTTNVQTGSLLTQSFLLTNTANQTVILDLVRYLDGDLFFDNSLIDGGGRLISGGNEFLFETDAGGGSNVDTTFIGIDGNGGDPLTIGRFEVDDFPVLGTKIASGGSLTNTISGDLNGDGFVDLGREYDITLGLRNVFTLAPGASAIYVTRTVFGSGTPEDVSLDNPQVDLGPDVAVMEGNSGLTNLVFSVTLSKVGSAPISIPYQTVSGSAIAPDDYQAASGTLTFLPEDSTTKFITILVVGDEVSESNESFSLVLGEPTGVVLGRATATGTILNDDIDVVINDITVVELNSGTTNAVFTVSTIGDLNSAISVSYTTVSETAIGGSDFVMQAGSVQFQAGNNTARITIPVIGDTRNEANETFGVLLTSATGGARIADNLGRATIIDNDPLPNFYVSDEYITTTTIGNYVAHFTVALDMASGREVTVGYSTSEGTARDGIEYQGRSGQLTFAPGVTTLHVSVPVMTSNLYGPNRQFYLRLNSPTNAHLHDPEGKATIVYDNEQLGEYIVDDGDAAYTRTAGWSNLTNTLGYQLDYDYAPAGNGSSSATWSFVGIPNGQYQVFARWSHFSNRATNAPFTILDLGVPVATVLVNQQLAPTGDYSNGFHWQSLGTFSTTTNNLAVRLANNANGYVIADAIRIVAGGIAPQTPEMDVSGIERSIITGDITPAMEDGTHFGFVPTLTDSVVHTFRITNNGNADLHLSGAPPVSISGPHAGDFQVVSQPATTIAPGRYTTFQVVFHPSAGGQRNAVLSIANNDDSEHPYAFLLEGSGSGGGATLAHNASLPADVNADTRVTANDLLILINNLLAQQHATSAAPQAAEPLAAPAAGEAVIRPYYIDVNADGRLTASDLLGVINYLLRSEAAPQAAPAAAAAEEVPLAAPAVDEALVLFDDLATEAPLVDPPRVELVATSKATATAAQSQAQAAIAEHDWLDIEREDLALSAEDE